MEWMMVFKAVLSLAFVLGLLLLTLWCAKYCELHGIRNRFVKKLSENQRIRIAETRKIDQRNTLVLVEKDDREYLLLLGGGQNLLVEAETIKKKAGN